MRVKRWALAAVLTAGALCLEGPLTPAAGQAQTDTVRATVVGSQADTLRAAVIRSQAENDSVALAEAFNAYGLYLWGQARYDGAVVNLQKARSVWSAMADSVGLGRVYNNLGVTHFHWGNLEDALDSYLRSLSVRRALGDPVGTARVLTNIGLVYRSWGLNERARETMQEAVAVADASGDSFVRGYSRYSLGMALIAGGDAPGARGAFEESLRYYQDEEGGVTPAQTVSGRGLNMHGLGRVALMEGDPDRAVAILEEILGGSPEGARTGRQVDVLLDLGRAYLAAGAFPKAIATLERAAGLSRDAGQRGAAALALGALSEAYEAGGEPALALRYLRRRMALQDSLLTESGARQVASVAARVEAERQALENQALREDRRKRESVIARQRLGFLLGGALLAVFLALVAALTNLNRQGRARRQEMATANQELREALGRVRTLEGLIPICARCKRVRGDKGFWESVESYVSSRSDALFSHGICSECGPELYGEFWDPEAGTAVWEEGAPPHTTPGGADHGAGVPADGLSDGSPSL